MAKKGKRKHKERKRELHPSRGAHGSALWPRSWKHGPTFHARLFNHIARGHLLVENKGSVVRPPPRTHTPKRERRAA